MRQPRISHKAPRGIRKLALLEMETRIRESVEITRMIVMQMREDDILDIIRTDIERTKRLHRATQKRPLSLSGYFRVETGIDDKGATSSPCQPHEIIHRHRAVVRIAADEMLAPPRLAGGIADGKELVFLLGHAIS